MSKAAFRLLAALALGSLPLAVNAQTTQFYSPPKLLKQGVNTTPLAGSGNVTLKVLVHKDGTVGTVTVLRSTNHGDDAAAKEIAQSSTYKPGARDAKPQDAFYTYNLKFNGKTAQADTGASTAGALAQADALLRAGKYADAKTALQTYLAGHAGDAQAQALLGVADGYLGDAAGAAAAFDAAGPAGTAKFSSVAIKAYNDAALAALNAHSYDQAIALSSKANALQPTVNGLYLLGTAEANAQQYPKAVADLEQARGLARDPKTISTIESTLVTAYLLGGDSQKGMTLAQQLKQRDPANAARVNDSIATYYVTQAQQQASAAKTNDDWKKVKATADQALAVAPNNAGALYVEGIALGNSGDLDGAKAALEKAKANAGSDAQLGAQIDAQLAQVAKLGKK